MKVLFIVPDGVGIRNYLYSNLIQELHSKGVETQLYHKVSQAALVEIKKSNANPFKEYKELPNLKENFFSRFLRESSAYARLIYFSKILKNNSIKYFWKKNPKKISLKIFFLLCKLPSWFLSSNYKVLRSFEKRYEKSIQSTIAYKTAIKDLKELNPDFIINLHQRAPITSPVIIAAKQLNIKTSTIIFSWDNVPKGRLICRPNTYFVWSQLMKDQLCVLYKEINPKNVFIVGSPQFEFYKKNQFKLSKEDFFRQYNLDTNKKTICFSGDDLMTSPYDQYYLEDLCSSLSEFPESSRPQIIFRRCPVDFSSRFDEVIKKYNNIITVINPDWKVEKESQKNSFSMIYPSYNDLKILVNTCLHSDAVINLGSTMAHDFAVYNKPCFYLNYDPLPNKSWSVKKIYQYEHFRSMKDLDAVCWINSKLDFYPLISKAIYDEEDVAKDRSLWLERIILHPIENNSAKLANKIIEKCTSVS